MPTEKISMRKIREVLRLTFEAGLNQHQVAASVRLSQGAVSKYLALARIWAALVLLFLVYFSASLM